MTPTDHRHVVAYTDATIVAGAERALATLVTSLPEPIEITIVGPHRPTIEWIADQRPRAGVVTAPPLGTARQLGGALRVARLLRHLRPSLIHLNKTDVGNLRYVQIVVEALVRCPVVSVVHHVEPPATATVRRLSRVLARREAATVAVSNALARELEHILGIEPQRVTAIPNRLAPLAVNRHTSADVFTIGTLARLVPHKGVHHLVEAMVGVDGARLVVGGDGPERVRLEQLVARLGLDDRVELLGWVDPADVLEQCDIVASASLIEGHPLTLLDAQQLGIPVVATDVGGVPEIVEHGCTGLLVPPADVPALRQVLSRLAHDRPFVEAMAAEAQSKAAAGGTPTDMAAEYNRIYWPADAPVLAGNHQRTRP